MWLVGQGFYDLYAATSFPSSPNLADLCWLGFATLGAAGVHRLWRGEWRLTRSSALELIPLIVAVIALIISLLESNISTSRLSGLEQATAVAYPILYVSAVMVILQAAFTGALDLRQNRAMAVVLGGMIFNAVGFILWSSQLLAGSYLVGANAVDGLWSAGMILVGTGAWAARAPQATIRGSAPVRQRQGGFLPAMTFVVVAGVQSAPNAGDVEDVVLGGSVLIIGMTLIAHAWVLRRRQDELLTRLHERERELREVNRRLAEESRRDALTGLANRLCLDEDFAELAALAKRHGAGFCLVLIDLDRFKDYNDGYGHQAGDHVLRRVAGLLDQTARAYERAYRHGGEELILLLRDQDSQAGQILAERSAPSCKPLPCPTP